MQQVALFTIIVCLLFIAGEYLWLFTLAKRQERKNSRLIKDREQIRLSIKTVLTADTIAGREQEIERLAQFFSAGTDRLDMLTDSLLEVILAKPNEQEQRAISALLSRCKPVSFYARLLQNGSPLVQAAACQKVALYFGQAEIPELRKLMASRNKELVYSAAMALSRLGDGESVFQYVQSTEHDPSVSHRLLLEMLEQYGGNLEELAGRLFAACNEYTCATVMKGVAKKRYSRFHALYRQNTLSRQANLASAALCALGELGDPADLHLLLTAAHHKEWLIRSAAVKALAHFPGTEAQEALRKATGDPEWWVRFNAARALLQNDQTLTYAERVLGGYDRYAADAVKYALYRQALQNSTQEL